MRKETSWILSNIAAGTISQIDQLLKREDIFTQISRMYFEDQLEVKQELMYVFVNLGQKL